uniref:Ribosomal protein S10 n=1 Tax=Mastigias sp. TaxID=3082107 RepID=A0AAU0GX98_9CNID|nr:hypothetical protein [Phyllorhiza punctata]
MKITQKKTPSELWTYYITKKPLQQPHIYTILYKIIHQYTHHPTNILWLHANNSYYTLIHYPTDTKTLKNIIPKKIYKIIHQYKISLETITIIHKSSK